MTYAGDIWQNTHFSYNRQHRETNPCRVNLFQGAWKWICINYHYQNRVGTSNRCLSSLKASTKLSSMLKTSNSDGLVLQVTWTSAAMALTWYSLNISVSPPEGSTVSGYSYLIVPLFSLIMIKIQSWLTEHGYHITWCQDKVAWKCCVTDNW